MHISIYLRFSNKPSLFLLLQPSLCRSIHFLYAFIYFSSALNLFWMDYFLCSVPWKKYSSSFYSYFPCNFFLFTHSAHIIYRNRRSGIVIYTLIAIVIVVSVHFNIPFVCVWRHAMHCDSVKGFVIITIFTI